MGLAIPSSAEKPDMTAPRQSSAGFWITVALVVRTCQLLQTQGELRN
jgi:hypothetical protein